MSLFVATTLSIKGLFATSSINDTKHNTAVMLSVIILNAIMISVVAPIIANKFLSAKLLSNNLSAMSGSIATVYEGTVIF